MPVSWCAVGHWYGGRSANVFSLSVSLSEEPGAASSARAKKTDKEETPMEVDELISDPSFLQNVLENLPGVDPQSEAIRDVVGSLNKDNNKKKEEKKKDDSS